MTTVGDAIWKMLADAPGRSGGGLRHGRGPTVISVPGDIAAQKVEHHADQPVSYLGWGGAYEAMHRCDLCLLLGTSFPFSDL